MRHAFGLTVFFMMSLAITAAPVPKEKPMVKDEDAILGTWQLEKLEMGEGAKGPPPGEDVTKIRFIFKKENKLTVSHGDRDRKEGDFKIDPAAKPKTLDLIEMNRTALGIYELDGDTLKLAISEGAKAERPTEMKPNAEKRVAVATMKRVKEGAAEEKKPIAVEAAKPAPVIK